MVEKLATLKDLEIKEASSLDEELRIRKEIVKNPDLKRFVNWGWEECIKVIREEAVKWLKDWEKGLPIVATGTQRRIWYESKIETFKHFFNIEDDENG